MSIQQYSLDVVKRAAVGRWIEILTHFTGVPEHFFGQEKEGPCFYCGGNTKFRVYDDFANTGGCRCNGCGNWGTGFHFIVAKVNLSWAAAINAVGEFLNCEPKKSRRSRPQSTKKIESESVVPNMCEEISGSEIRNMEHPDREALRDQLKVAKEHRIQILRDRFGDLDQAEEDIERLKREIGSPRWLAEKLSVSIESLESLGLEYEEEADAWIFPEWNSSRQIVGHAKRFSDDSKGFVRGGNRGLYFKADWLDQLGPILIVEGASDTAAGITLDLAVIGRPSAIVPKAMENELSALIEKGGVDRGIIVLGENDKKSELWQKDPKQWPGRDAAIKTAKFLSEKLKCNVKWALPPEGVKDLRQWLVANPGKCGAEFIDSLTTTTIKFESRDDAKDLDPQATAEFYLNDRCRYHGDLTLRHYRGAFWRWQDRRWVEVPDDEVRASVALYVGEYYHSIKTSTINNVIEFVRAHAIVPSTTEMPCWLDGRAGESIAFQNGVAAVDDLILDKPDCLEPHSPMWFSQVILPYEFQPAAECPHWMEVLVTNLEGDAERMDLLQEYAGYCLTKSTEYHLALLFRGEGQNGKSVTLAGITAILGTQNVSNLSLDELGEKFKRCRVVGKLANICADISETSRACEGTLKKLISGDALEFERKHRDAYSAIPTAKLIFSTNTLPQFHDKSNGLWRRIRIMPFNRQVTEVEKVTGMDQPEYWLRKGELPGMFNWAMCGLRQLKQKGAFTQSRKCNEAVNQHRLECNHTLSWLREEFERTEEGTDYSKPQMYSQYCDHCQEYGFKALSITAFGKEVVKAFGKMETKRSFDPWNSGRRSRFYCGLRRIPDDSEKRDEHPV